MKKVKIINTTSIEYEFPSSWDELTERQIIKINRFLDKYHFDKTEGIKILLTALNLPFRSFRAKTKKRVENLLTLNGEWIHTLLRDERFLGFIFTPDGIEKQRILKFRHNLVTYHAPGRDILDVSAIELTTAYNMFVFYSRNQKQIYLDKLVALLYRPSRHFIFLEKMSADFNRDIRKKLNPYHWNKRVDRIKNLDMGVKLSILREFSSEWQRFEKQFPNVFRKSSGSKYDSEMWIKLLMQMSGKTFGTLEEIKMHNAREVFSEIDMTIEQADEIKRKLKQKK